MNNILTRDDVLSLVAEIDTQLILGGTTVEAVKYSGTLKALLAEESSLKKVKERLLGMPVVAITIAFWPTEEFVAELSKWIKDNVSQEAVIDLKIDPSIGGGVLLTYKGRYIDNTLNKGIVDVFGTNKSELLMMAK